MWFLFFVFTLVAFQICLMLPGQTPFVLQVPRIERRHSRPRCTSALMPALLLRNVSLAPVSLLHDLRTRRAVKGMKAPCLFQSTSCACDAILRDKWLTNGCNSSDVNGNTCSQAYHKPLTNPEAYNLVTPWHKHNTSCSSATAGERLKTCVRYTAE